MAYSKQLKYSKRWSTSKEYPGVKYRVLDIYGIWERGNGHVDVELKVGNDIYKIEGGDGYYWEKNGEQIELDDFDKLPGTDFECSTMAFEMATEWLERQVGKKRATTWLALEGYFIDGDGVFMTYDEHNKKKEKA